MRAGAQALSLLGAPRNYLILRALADGAKGQLDLRRAAGSPAQSTLRGHLNTLEGTGALARRRRDAFPGALEYELTQPGHELVGVAARLRSWLAQAPSGPIAPGTDPARAAVKGLVDSWDAKILARLAEAPLSLTELDKRLATVSYPTIERRIETMRLADQIEVGRRTSAGTPHTIVPWVRLGLGPLAAAARWEQANRIVEAEPLTRAEIESAFRIVGPVLNLPSSLDGVCQLAVRAPTEQQRRRRFLGLVRVGDGEVFFGEACAPAKPSAWASGTTTTWYSVILDGDHAGLRKSGDTDLLDALFERIHGTLCPGGDGTGVTAA